MAEHSKPPGRRPRLPQGETERRVLDAAVAMVNASGLTVSLEHLSFEAAIQRADVSRTAAYRRWPQKELFLQDLLAELAAAAAPAAVVQNVSLGLLSDLVHAEADGFHDPERRQLLVVELVRQATDTDFEAMYNSTEWRTYLALNATFLSLADGRLRDEVQTVLARAQQGFVDRLSASWARLTALLGYRLRPGLRAGFDVLAQAITASVRGLLLMALSDPRIASGRVEADPSGTGAAPWSLAALTCATIATGFLEPDPEVVWDADRVAALLAAFELSDPDTGRPIRG